MFNENKFKQLSSINRLKKLAFSLRDCILKRSNEHSYKPMIEWLNINEAYRFIIPRTPQECQHLYEQIVERIYREDPYQEKTLFDSPHTTRKIFDITIILDNIRSPFNVGSFFRTSEALGVKELWLVGVSPNPQSNAKIAKTAKGAIISYLTFDSYKEVMSALPSTAHIIGIEKTNHSKDIGTLEFSPYSKDPLFLIFGNEEFGISKEFLDLCKDVYHIPLLGQKNSLNVSVAAGISLYIVSALAALMPSFEIKKNGNS